MKKKEISSKIINDWNSALVYMEFGYIQCKKGYNIEKARDEFRKTYFGFKK